MRIADLGIPEEIKELLNKSGYDELYPPQEDAFKAGVLEGKNLVLASPTASGKTLVAEICAIKHLLEKDGKVLYLTPLRALAWEKYETFLPYTVLDKADGRKIRVGISTGDLDSSTPWLERYDIVITTNEKCDSLLRHRSNWMNSVSLVIADEIHLIGDERGPTLEVALTRLRQMKPDLQILALSATVRNANEVAEWLKAESVTTEWRPVELKEGIAHNNTVTFKNGSYKQLNKLHGINAVNIALNAVLDGGQSLIFVESRQRSTSLARESASALDSAGVIPRRLMGELQKISSDILIHGERTRLSDELALYVSRGAAFHHAGLSSQHRRLIEDFFREGKTKILVATPTLAAGVNLPARTVVIGNYRRFVPGYGMSPISVMEYKQMSGRAGRPQYDEFGEAILIASSQDEMDMLMEEFVLAKPERLYSRLASEASLRGHVLAAISSDYAHSEQGLLDFFGGTFYGYHYNPSGIRDILNQTLSFFLREGMIKFEKDYVYATDFGRRVSELYIDPLSAVVIRDGLKRGATNITDYTWLHMICHTPDMRPILRPRSREIESVELYLEEHREELAFPLPDEDDYIEHEQFLGEVKTAVVLDAWINEVSESDILERFSVEPGDRYSAVLNAEWLLYSAHELAEVLGIKERRRHFAQLKDRVKNGVTTQLLPLVKLKGIGRVRARVLYNSGFTSIASLKRAPLNKLVEIPLIGARLAKQIKEQVGGLIEEEEWRKLETVEAEQRALTEFIEEETEGEEPT